MGSGERVPETPTVGTWPIAGQAGPSPDPRFELRRVNLRMRRP